MHQLADSEIIQQVLAGQQQAYAVLVERYQRMVFTIALRLTDNREEAEEIAQDVFVKAYRNLQDYKGTGKFSTWLYTIARTTALSVLRSKKGNTVLLEQEALHMVIDCEMQVTLHSTEQKSRDALLRQAISQLPESDAQVLTLYYHGEQTTEEIAAILLTNANQVKVKLHRARQKLREVLENNYPTELRHLK